MAKINIDFKLQNDIDIAFNDSATIDLDFGFDAVYTGAYEVDPTVDGYELEVANKRMLKDLKVKQIALSEVENAQGGYTYTIAGSS